VYRLKEEHHGVICFNHMYFYIQWVW